MSSARVRQPKPEPVSEPNGTKAAPTAIEARFADAQSRLGPHRQQLIRNILGNCEEACFLSSRELARRYDVDAATVVRTAQALGYNGFADFSVDLRQHFMSRITPYTALEAAAREKRSVADHIDHSLDKAADNLNVLRSNLDRAKVVELARQIHRARRVLVIGLDFAAFLSHYLAYGLTVLGFDAEAPNGSEGSVQHKVKLLTAKDLLVAISFGRCLRVTVEAAVRAGKLGAPTFGITDSDSTPIARLCGNHLVAAVVSPSFLNSYVAPIRLINAIHVACAHFDPKRSLSQLKPTDKEYRAGLRWYREPKDSGANGG
jgi:DNA-binding MurR/RpiR family transcriptional regulator